MAIYQHITEKEGGKGNTMPNLTNITQLIYEPKQSHPPALTSYHEEYEVKTKGWPSKAFKFVKFSIADTYTFRNSIRGNHLSQLYTLMYQNKINRYGIINYKVIYIIYIIAPNSSRCDVPLSITTVKRYGYSSPSGHRLLKQRIPS